MNMVDKMREERELYVQYYRGKTWTAGDMNRTDRARIRRHPEQIARSLPRGERGVHTLAARLRELVGSDNFDDFVPASYCCKTTGCKNVQLLPAYRLPFSATSTCDNVNAKSCLCGHPCKHFGHLLHVPTNTLVIIGNDCRHRFVTGIHRVCTACGVGTNNYSKVCDACKPPTLQACAIPGCTRDCYALRKKASWFAWDRELAQRVVCRYHRSPVGAAEVVLSRRCEGCETSVPFNRSIYNKVCVNCQNPFQVCCDHDNWVRCKNCS